MTVNDSRGVPAERVNQCEVCGRPIGGNGEKRCEELGRYPAFECYRLGYESEKARANALACSCPTEPADPQMDHSSDVFKGDY